MDDHSRYAVAAKVVRRATGRAVCSAFAEAMVRYGIPEEILAEPGSPPASPPARWDGGAVEFERVVPPSGNLQVAGKQFWLGPARS